MPCWNSRSTHPPKKPVFFKIPALKLLFTIWLIATITFIFPLFLGLKKLKHKNILFTWIISYIILILLYVVSAGWSISRFMLPALPAIALIWSNGLDKIRYKKIATTILAMILVGFVSTGFVKVIIATNSWNSYNDDFDWIKANTNKEAVLLGYQCLSYNSNKFSIIPRPENIKKADYIFVNENFKLEGRSIVKDDILDTIKEEDFEKSYNNPKTGTIIYKTS